MRFKCGTLEELKCSLLIKTLNFVTTSTSRKCPHSSPALALLFFEFTFMIRVLSWKELVCATNMTPSVGSEKGRLYLTSPPTQPPLCNMFEGPLFNRILFPIFLVSGWHLSLNLLSSNTIQALHFTALSFKTWRWTKHVSPKGWHRATKKVRSKNPRQHHHLVHKLPLLSITY